MGSLKIEYKPTDIVVPDQFFDRTRHRPDTFFGNGLVAHVSMADPVCPRLSALAAEAAREAGVAITREMLAQVKDRVAGAYIMPPFNKVDLAVRVVEALE